MRNYRMNLKHVAGVIFLMTTPAAVFAQAPDANSILNGAAVQLNGMAGLIINVVSIVMGLVGAVMLAVNLAKYFKGDPSSNDALMKVGGGLLIAVVLLQVIRMTFLQGA